MLSLCRCPPNPSAENPSTKKIYKEMKKKQNVLKKVGVILKSIRKCMIDEVEGNVLVM